MHLLLAKKPAVKKETKEDNDKEASPVKGELDVYDPDNLDDSMPIPDGDDEKEEEVVEKEVEVEEEVEEETGELDEEGKPKTKKVMKKVTKVC